MNALRAYGVTGASGRLGRLAVEQLLERGVPAERVVALVRAPEKAADLAARGVQVREADYGRPATLAAGLAGVERLLLISSSDAEHRVAHHASVIHAARSGDVTRIVYTSMLGADSSANALAREHRATEQTLSGAGLPFTTLRNGWYTENYTDHVSRYVEAGEIVGATATGRVSAASRPDLARAAVAALLEDANGNRTYELGGPAFDLFELARLVTQITGREVTYRHLPAPHYAAELQQAGLDAATARFIAELDASIADGELETDSQDLERLIDRPPETVQKILSRWDGDLRTRPSFTG